MPNIFLIICEKFLDTEKKQITQEIHDTILALM